MLPYIILHVAMSVDGRIDWFTPDVGLFYELASRWNEDATLAGSNTVFNQGEEIPPEGGEALSPPEKNPDDQRPLLVVPDSKGKMRNWHVLRQSGYWRDMVALCSQSTPKTYFEYLRERHIDCIVTGDDHVDLRSALEELNARYNVGTIRVDSGGTLNGVLLRNGLVDEISVFIDPCLVGGITPRSIFRAADLTSPDELVPLKLENVERLDGDMIWLQYKVVKR